MSYTRTYPLILEFMLLGKAKKMHNYIKQSPALLPYLDTVGPKVIVLKFNDEGDRNKFAAKLARSPYVQKQLRTKMMTIS